MIKVVNVSAGITNKTQLLFESSDFLESESDDKKLLSLKPYGMQIATDGSRPSLLLRDEKNEHNMPVALNNIEAGVALTQSNPSLAPSTPHRVFELLAQSLNIRIVSCTFVEIKACQQFVKLTLENHPTQSFLKLRADEAMSLCLHLNVPIFATAQYMAKSRVLASEAETIAKTLALNPEVLKSQQKYMQ